MNTYSLERDFDSFTLCSKCTDNKRFNCYGSDKLCPKKGYWRYLNMSTAFFGCPNEDSCLGDLSANSIFDYTYSTGVCESGYTGVLCYECAEDYGKISDLECTTCFGVRYVFT